MVGFFICLFKRLILKKGHTLEHRYSEYDEENEEWVKVYKCKYCDYWEEETEYESIEEYKTEQFFLKYPNYDY